jgi:MoxR-like ATPase
MDPKTSAERIIENVSRVIVGKRDVVELCLVALLCEGHVLLEDVPGIGKTTLAKALSRSVGCTFKRIQFTPDLLPSDVTGILYFNQKRQEFEFRPGPIMSQIVLADEINRATPRTQSALLEAMQERQVTVDVETKRLPRPFMVLATQNPIELEGTFPLPEAQVDRFLMRVSLGYPGREEESEILVRYEREDPLDGLEPVVQADDLWWTSCGLRGTTKLSSWASVRGAPWPYTGLPRPWLPSAGGATLCPTTSSTWRPPC